MLGAAAAAAAAAVGWDIGSNCVARRRCHQHQHHHHHRHPTNQQMNIGIALFVCQQQYHRQQQVNIDVVDSRDRKARKIGSDIERKIGKLGRKRKKS